jgi:hypothetical protein
MADRGMDFFFPFTMRCSCLALTFYVLLKAGIAGPDFRRLPFQDRVIEWKFAVGLENQTMLWLIQFHTA